MHQPDFEEFSTLMKRLAEVFGKKLTDDTVQGYWDALKDQPLPSVKRLANSHTKVSKFFPKPFELRPKEDKPVVVRDSATEAAFREGEERAIRNLEELRRRDPVTHRREVALRKLDRLIATTHESDPAYPMILCEWRTARGIHVGDREWDEAGRR